MQHGFEKSNLVDSETVVMSDGADCFAAVAEKFKMRHVRCDKTFQQQQLNTTAGLGSRVRTFVCETSTAIFELFSNRSILLSYIRSLQK